MSTALALKAPIARPVYTGTVAINTPASTNIDSALVVQGTLNVQPKIPGVHFGTTGDDQYGLSIVSDTATGDSFINCARPNIGHKGRISYSMAVNQMFFYVNGGNRMTLSSNN